MFLATDLIKGKQIRLLNVLCYLRNCQHDLQRPQLFDARGSLRTPVAAGRKLSPEPVSEGATADETEGKTPGANTPNC